MKRSKQFARSQQGPDGPTFFETFNNAIEAYEAKETYKEKKSEDVQFNLFEDLKLLLELSKIPSIESKHFESIANHLGRSKGSVKKRYQEYLKNIRSEDLQEIYNFIEKHGLNGNLIFKVDKGKWTMTGIKLNARQQSYKIVQATPAKEENKSFIQQQQSSLKTGKKAKINQSNYQLSANSKYDTGARKIKLLNTAEKAQLNQDQKKESEELAFSLKIFSDWTSIPYSDCIQRLFQCSGNLDYLVDVYMNQEENILWTKEADEALKEFYNSTNEEEKNKLKAVLRNEEQNANRKEWLAI